MNPIIISALNALPEECWTCTKEKCDRETCIPFQKALKEWTSQMECNPGGAH